MTDIAFPSLTAARTEWGFRRNQARAFGISGKRIDVDLTGSRYICHLSMPPLVGADATAFRNAIARATDVDTYLLLPDDGYDAPSQAGLSPLVRGASQTGASIIIDNLPVSTTGVIKAATRFQSSDYDIFEAVADANSDASGIATVSLLRPIRVSPADNDPLEIYDPLGRFQIDDDFVRWVVSPPSSQKIHDFTPFSLTEA